MTAIIILNIVFAAAVIIGIVGMLTRSIQADKVGATAVPARTAPRFRRSTARSLALGRTADTRA